MAIKQGAARVTAREIDKSQPTKQEPIGVPAAIIGTTKKGPAFVPVTVGNISEWEGKFGKSDGKKYAPLAAQEWLRNAGSLVTVRVLGAGNGLKRDTTAASEGRVVDAGFVVGEQLPDASLSDNLSGNPYANSGSSGSPLGRTYFLGCFMSESAGSTIFSSASLQGPGNTSGISVTSSIPVVRGILMVPSGVIARLSSSFEGSSTPPASTLVASDSNASGTTIGSVVLSQNNTAKQEFVLLLNGHKGTDPLYPNVLTASFDLTSPNYFLNVFNTNPYAIQQAGHYLYTHWDIHPVLATVTGSGIVTTTMGASATANSSPGKEPAAFIISGSNARNVGTSTAPNYESFEDRYSYSETPWIISQQFGGIPMNLFKLVALNAGSGQAEGYKVMIENIMASTDPNYQYGTFDVVIRDASDTDDQKVVLEQFRGLSLDPSSDRYICKMIGDINTYYDWDRTETAQKIVIEGNYENVSNLFRCVINPLIETGDIDPTALPFGFRGLPHLVISGSAPLPTVSSTALISATTMKRVVEPPLPFRWNITIGADVKKIVNPQLCWGVQFEHVKSLTTPNMSNLDNDSSAAWSAWLPSFSSTLANFVTGSNEGQADTTANGILDADRYNRNLFTLENIQVVTASNGHADPQQWVSALYFRDGAITTNDTAKTRALSTLDCDVQNKKFIKFCLPVKGGWDGVNIFDRDEAELTNTAVYGDMNASNRNRSSGPNVRAYRKAIDILKSTTNVDIQLLAIPGIRESVVTDYAIDAVESRFDAMYVMDIQQRDDLDAVIRTSTTSPSVTTTVNAFVSRGLNSSFAAAYFPDVLMQDPNTLSNLYVPPSVQVLGALALNDAIGHPWFAPAGFTRGVLPTALEGRVTLKTDNQDVLYDSNINPLLSFPGAPQSGTNPKGGVVVWGQKTLQQAASALDRVNVRRLLIDLRRQVRDIARSFIFEPTRAATLAKFSAAVTPVLTKIKNLSGVKRFKVVIDASTTTEADNDNNILRGKIYVQPSKTIEYVSLDFEVSNKVD